MLGIVIFAMVAAFLGMRLYAVLGKRTGHEQPLTRPSDDLLRPPGAPAAPEDQRDAVPPQIEQLQSPGTESGLRAISVADRQFSSVDFLDGAKSAYRLILEAFWAGREEDFRPYVSEEVRASFADSIAERTSEGHVLDNRLVTIDRAQIVDASCDGKLASITVKFVADIAAVTRDASGNVVAGSLTDAVPTEDVWTFARDVRAADPNWILTDTDEAA